MPNYYIWTIGCQMNKADSRRIGHHLEQRGYRVAVSAESADLIILNSCVVRQSAENRVIGRLNALKNLKATHPSLVIALTGCMVTPSVDRLRERYPDVDFFFPAGAIPDFIQASVTTPEASLSPDGPTAFVTIIEGCNNFCTYCIVPYRRGREKSRSPDDIARDVTGLVNQGAKEITLLGQNVDSYGHDLNPVADLADLLERLNEIPGLARLRFLTNHPKDMSLKLIDRVARLDKVCEEISLPVQSGSDEILRAMGRDYTAEEYLNLVGEIRRRIPEAGLSTDVIVGFPGETDAQFEATFNLLSSVGFDKVHVAAYSPRPETLAARKLTDSVPILVKQERRRRVEELQQETAGAINARLEGKKMTILVEGKKGGRWQGRTRSGKLTFFSAADDCRGQIVDIEINKTSPWALQGILVTT